MKTPDIFHKKIADLRPKLSLGKETDQSAFTGERFLPGYVDGSIELEHVHRYVFALPFVVDRIVLDVACGEGYGCDLLAQVANTVIGIDTDEPTIALASGRYARKNLSFRTGSATALPLENHSVDAITSFETIEHLEDQDAFWSEIKRVLRTDGILILSSPNREAYRQQRSAHNPYHKHELEPEELVQELSRRFAHCRMSSQSIVFGSVLLPSSEPILPCVISLDPMTQILRWEFRDQRSCPYSVALASDEAIPATGQSLYTGNYPAGAMSALMGGVVERDQLVRELRHRIAELETSFAGVQHDRDEMIRAAESAEQSLAEQTRLFTLRHDEAQSEAMRLKERLREQDNDISALEAHLRDRDETIRAAKSAEENLVEQTQLLTSRRDQALLEAMRARETLAEQDGVIDALKTLLEECGHGSPGAGTATSSGQRSTRENDR